MIFFLLFSASSVICLGQEFRPGRMVCILKPSDTEYPAVFGEIQRDHCRRLEIFGCSAHKFIHHYFAYKVCSTNTLHIVLISKLAMHQVFHKYNVHSQNFVVVRSCHHIEPLYLLYNNHEKSESSLLKIELQ